MKQLEYLILCYNMTIREVEINSIKGGFISKVICGKNGKSN